MYLEPTTHKAPLVLNDFKYFRAVFDVSLNALMCLTFLIII